MTDDPTPFERLCQEAEATCQAVDALEDSLSVITQAQKIADTGSDPVPHILAAVSFIQNSRQYFEDAAPPPPELQPLIDALYALSQTFTDAIRDDATQLLAAWIEAIEDLPPNIFTEGDEQ